MLCHVHNINFNMFTTLFTPYNGAATHDSRQDNLIILKCSQIINVSHQESNFFLLNQDKILRAERVFLSQTRPMWLATDGFRFHLIQSPPNSCMNACIFSLSISSKALFVHYLLR